MKLFSSIHLNHEVFPIGTWVAFIKVKGCDLPEIEGPFKSREEALKVSKLVMKVKE